MVAVGCLATAVVIGLRYARASGPRRRALLPSVAGIGALLLFAVAQGGETPIWFRWVAVLSLLAVPAGFLVGLLRSRLARGGLADLFRRLPTMRGEDLQPALAQVLGDPTAEIVRGHPYADDGRGAAVINEEATLVYDASLDDDPELIEAVVSAAAIALESRARLGRIVTAGDDERRRLERNLHDGAQQRLVALAMQLRLVQHEIHTDPAAAQALVDTASKELALSLEELRELARGIHPAVLDHGLEPALHSLAGQATVPTEVAYDAEGRLPEPIELAAYFVTSEALANVGKYARAQQRERARGAPRRRAGGRDRRRRDRRRRRRARLRPARARRPRRGARRPAAGRQPAGGGDRGARGAAVRVVIADDSLLVREGIASLLRRAGVEVVGEADDGEELQRVVDEHEPDVAIVDVRMPPTHTEEGLAAAREIRARHPGMGILILSQHVEVGIAMRALVESPEGLGYLLKERVTDLEDFAGTLRHVAAGGSALDPQVVARLLADPRGEGPLSTLTDRERQVLELVAEGRTNKAIAERLDVSQRAVTKHVTSIFAKLELPPGEDDHRRILAVLTYLRTS